eukprot:Seg914.6 transcript_id=Seg914.6/GoldUCD/mRNA.D3Y31 product="Glycoprotein-associated_amino acid transporter b0,+AT1" protein_id=Seg914.6/GoldUCD/D3Y31
MTEQKQLQPEDGKIDSINITTARNYSETSSLIGSSSSLSVSVNLFITSGRELRKNIGCIHAFAYIVGILFGSGIFISPSLVARETSNMGMAIIVWVVAAIPCLFGALCFCELATMLKKSGGEYVFIKETFGNLAAFVTLWTQTFMILPPGLAVLAVTIGQHVIAPFYDIKSTNGLWMTKGVAILTILIAATINSVSTSFVNKTQVVFTIFQFLAVLFLAALGLWKVSTGHTGNYYHMFANTSTNFDVGSFGIALYNGLWAYDGWGYISYLTEELQNPERDLWLSIVTGIPFVAVCYVLINLGLMSALTRDEIASSETVATTFVQKIFGKKVAMIMLPIVALSCFCSLDGILFTASRALLSGAREGQLPEPLSYIDRDKRTPVAAALFIGISIVLWILLLGNGTQALITSFSFAVWLTYALGIISVVVLRVTRPDAHRPFKVWIANPIFTGLCAVFLVVAPFIKNPVQSSISLAFILLSLPVYHFLIYKHDSLPERFKTCKKNFYCFILCHSNLVPCIFNADNEGKNNNDIL